MKKNNAPLFQGFVLGKGAVKEQVYHILRDHILEGRLPPGTKMPSTRALSEMMSISRNSAIAGYDRLLDEGYIQTRKGSGTYVSHNIPDRSISNSYPKIASGASSRLMNRFTAEIILFAICGQMSMKGAA